MAAWPPRTGVANVYEGVIIARSSRDTEIELTFSATEASNRPILMARARATSLPAVVEVRYQVDHNEKPGCDGVAARLPKDPGVQKLSPVSSAQARSGTSASAAATAPGTKRCRHEPCRQVPSRQVPSRAPDPFVPIAPLWSPASVGSTIRTAARASAAAGTGEPGQHEECWRLLPVGNTGARRVGPGEGGQAGRSVGARLDTELVPAPRAAAFAGTSGPNRWLVLHLSCLLFGPGILHRQGHQSSSRSIISGRYSRQLAVERSGRLISLRLKHAVGAGGGRCVRSEADATPALHKPAGRADGEYDRGASARWDL